MIPKSTIINWQDESLQSCLFTLQHTLSFHRPFSVAFELPLQMQDCKILSEWVAITHSLNQGKFSFCVDSTMLQHATFLFLLDALRINTPHVVEINIVDPQNLSEESYLNLANHANYPLLLIHANDKTHLSNPVFEALMIASIQAPQPIISRQAHIDNEFWHEDASCDAQLLKKPFALKALINSSQNNSHATPNSLLQIEIEHTEEVEQILEQNIDVAINTEHTNEHYYGDLIDYANFNTEAYYRVMQQSGYAASTIENAFKLAEQELFANLPHAIKYLTPDSAEKLASHLPQLVSLNKDHYKKSSKIIALGFYLKKTPQEEFVLDYDARLIDDQESDNIFMPRENLTVDGKKPYYHVSKSAEEWQGLIKQSEIFNELQQRQFTPLVNFWIRKGDAGVRRFFIALSQIDKKHPQLSSFLYKTYLSHFEHFDMLDSEDFYEALEKFASYSAQQMKCLKRFMAHTGSSQYHMLQMLEAFDVFWKEYSMLCAPNVDINLLAQQEWQAPKGGQPIVHMERLLVILSRARSIEDQLYCLDDLSLENYGPYYASRYEGFTLTAAWMHLIYNPQILNARPFHSGLQAYRVSLDLLFTKAKEAGNLAHEAGPLLTYQDCYWVIQSQKKEINEEEFQQLSFAKKAYHYLEYSTLEDELLSPTGLYYKCGYDRTPYYWYKAPACLSAARFYRLIYRYLGQQHAGISGRVAYELFQCYRNRNECYRATKEMDGHFIFPLQLLFSLFFITHEKYDDKPFKYENEINPPFNHILKRLESVLVDKLLLQIEHFKILFDNNIKLSVHDTILYSDIVSLHTSEMFGLPKVKSAHWAGVVRELPKRLFEYLKNSPSATLKLIQFIGNRQVDTKKCHYPYFWEKNSINACKIMSIYSLNIADYFRAIPHIAQRADDDLLIFSAQLNVYLFNDTAEYFAKRIEENDEPIQKLQQIRAFLHEAMLGIEASLPYFRVYKLLVSAAIFLEMETVIAIYNDVKCLPQINDPQELEQALITILLQHGITVPQKLPQLFQHDSHEVKACMIELINMLGFYDLIKKHIHITPSAFNVLFKYAVNKLGALAIDDTQTDPALQEMIQNFQAILVENPEILLNFAVHSTYINTLSMMTLPQLQNELKTRIAQSDTFIYLIAPTLFKSVLTSLKQNLIQEEFKKFDKDTDISRAHEHLPSCFLKQILALSDLQDTSDFDKVDLIVQRAIPIVHLVNTLMRHDTISKNEKAYLDIFSKNDYTYISSNTMHLWMSFLNEMPQRDYLSLLELIASDSTLLYEPTLFLKIIDGLRTLNHHECSTEYLVAYYSRVSIWLPIFTADYQQFAEQLALTYQRDTQDSMLDFLLNTSELSPQQAIKISQYTYRITTEKNILVQLFKQQLQDHELDELLALFETFSMDRLPNLLFILARAMSLTVEPEVDDTPDSIYSYWHHLNTYLSGQPTIRSASNFLIIETLNQLNNLTDESLEQFKEFYKESPLNLPTLSQGLKAWNNDMSFSHFLLEIEKTPYGKRDIKQQFDLSQVSRVINELYDMLNQTIYPFHYRKRVMETFLLVNEMGHLLPVFDGKPAMALSNAEIKKYIAHFKQEETCLKNQLYALALIRETMYRATSQMPYSTQMIVLIDCILHEGHLIAKIDTGQGKTLIDGLKAVLLWLDHDRVDLTTSSVIDAARDLNIMRYFLTLLGVPFAPKPILAVTPFSEFCPNGVNFTTVAQLTLFFMKTLVDGHAYDTNDQRIAMILNESDFTLLEDWVIKRLAMSDNFYRLKDMAWIYRANNDFVETEAFKQESTLQQDLYRMKRYLFSEARKLGKSPKSLMDYTQEDLLKWLIAACLVRYELQESKQYVVLQDKNEQNAYHARILMNDGRPSPDSVFGKTVHQHLHEKLNQQKRIALANAEDAFEIKPETKTIMSANNRLLINWYLAKKGRVLGSSGTPGSYPQLQEQYVKYRFTFTKVSPHQKQQINIHPLKVLDNQEKQYETIYLEVKKHTKRAFPTLIFCENIQRAEALYAYLKRSDLNISLQLFTGVENEIDIITNAALEGMYTITTKAIGRNTDIAYRKRKRLDIWFTFVFVDENAENQAIGRTGRQGSLGEIFYFLNYEDQCIKNFEDIKQLRLRHEIMMRQERDTQEYFYQVMQYFLSIVETISEDLFVNTNKKMFYRHQWATFSEQFELHYRENHLNSEFNRQSWFEIVKLQFSKIIIQAVPTFNWSSCATWQETHNPLPKPYHPNLQTVNLQDCLPRAQLLLPLPTLTSICEKALNEVDKQNILQLIKQLFENPNRRNMQKNNIKLFNLMHQYRDGLNEIRKIYQQFMTDFLQKRAHLSFWEKWFGWNKTLQQISSDPHYLCLFHALASINQDKTAIVDHITLQNIINSMFDDYLQCFWISNEKKAMALQLKSNLIQAEDDKRIIELLIQCQMTVADHDILQNKSRFFPTNYFGTSRLQNTISNALRLAASLNVHVDTKPLMAGLIERLNQTLHANNFIDNSYSHEQICDHIKQAPAIDLANKTVLTQTFMNGEMIYSI